MSSLTSLQIDECGCRRLPDSICQLLSLTELKLSSLPIRALPKHIGNIQSLKTLEIETCERLSNLPGSMRNLSSLSTLRMRDGGLHARGRRQTIVAHLTSLTSLDVEGLEHVARYPSEILCLKHLDEIRIVCIDGDDFPVSFLNLPILKNIEIYDMKSWDRLYSIFIHALPSLGLLEYFSFNATNVLPDAVVLFIARILNEHDFPRLMRVNENMLPLRQCWKELGLPEAAQRWTNNVILAEFNRRKQVALRFV